jgi:hypothetical protein
MRRILKSAERPTTAIAWAFPDRVIVRDEGLCSSLIGHLSSLNISTSFFPDANFHE